MPTAPWENGEADDKSMPSFQLSCWWNGCGSWSCLFPGGCPLVRCHSNITLSLLGSIMWTRYHLIFILLKKSAERKTPFKDKSFKFPLLIFAPVGCPVDVVLPPGSRVVSLSVELREDTARCEVRCYWFLGSVWEWPPVICREMMEVQGLTYYQSLSVHTSAN